MGFSTRFITGIRWYKGLLEMLNNMTYIYDPNWSPNNSVKATFPVCFFHVKSMHEVMSTEISQKQMLFYNSSVSSTNESNVEQTVNDSDPKLDSGLLNVVADNIVIKPKVYKLDVVIPYKNLSLLNQSFVYNTHTAQAITSALVNNKSTNDKSLGALATLSQPYLTFMKSLLNSMVATSSDSSVLELMTNTVQQPDYNKESLDVMWQMRHIVKMKVWNSWRYKYVAIVDIDITKEGTEDGVYEATLTLQEMPIVSMYPEGEATKSQYIHKDTLLTAKGKAVVDILDKAGNQFSKSTGE